MPTNDKTIGYGRRTIVRDLVIWLTIAVSATVIIQIAIYYLYSTHISEQELNARAESTTEELAGVLAISMWNLNQNVIRQISNAYLKSSYLAGIHIVDDHGNVMFDQVPQDDRHLITRKRTICWEKDRVGALKLWLTDKDAYRVQHIMIRSMMLIGISVLVIVIIVIQFIMRYVLKRPMNQLIQGIRNIAEGDYKSSMPPVPQKDINAIIKEANQMAGKIAKRDGQLNKEIIERSRAEGELKQLNKTLELRIGQLTEAEKALAESEKKYRGIFENALEGIFQTAPSGRFIDINPSMAAILGYDSAKELITTVTDIEKQIYVNPDHRKEILRLLQENDSISNYECQYFRKDGSKIWVVLQIRAFYNDSGEMTLLEGILQDITERKALQADAIRNARLASLGEMAAGVAHEINNPINGIINYAQILINRGKKQNRETELPGRIIKEGVRIERIVRSLLSFARERTEKKYGVRIHDIISETLDFTRSMLAKNGIHVLVKVPEDLPEIKANPGQIQQVFLNIISNARHALNQKYAAADDDKVLEIRADLVKNCDPQKMRITFHDKGMGIADDKIDRIWDPFFSTKPPNEGTGLGLSISHGIIKNHNGKLWAESETGKYTTIIAELPL
ncbi:MAG: ATP-binding protein [Thermodesulfobacteriota bacterium]